MIHIDEIWLSTQPMDMRAGMDIGEVIFLNSVDSKKKRFKASGLEISKKYRYQKLG